MRRLRADLILLFVAVLWGTGFVTQRMVAAQIGFFIFNALRFLLGALLLAPFAFRRPHIPRSELPWLALTGLVLFGGSALQQAGIRYTTTANAAFITGLYVVLVPILLSLAWRKRVPTLTWVSAFLAVVGIWLLSAGGTFGFSLGNSLELAGAFLWALHVILIGRLALRVDVLRLVAAQYLIAGGLHLFVSLFTDVSSLSALASTGWVIAYNGVFSIALGFTLQAVAQKVAPPADAAILLSMEAVFAALFGYLLLREMLLPIQAAGCALILIAMLLSQLRNHPEPAASSQTVENR
jgi:drug/metabolite transporter (DMT)-like permease